MNIIWSGAACALQQGAVESLSHRAVLRGAHHARTLMGKTAALRRRGHLIGQPLNTALSIAASILAGHRTARVGFAGMVVACVGLVVGCSTTSPVTVDRGHTDPAKCRGFDWLASAEPGAASADQRVRAVALDALRAKGYAVTPETPDCRMAYALSAVAAYQPGPQLGIGLGGGSGGIGGGLALSLPLGHRTATAARFRLDVIDSGGNVPIWSGWVDTQLAGPQPSQAEATALVQKILGKFPSRAP